MTKDKAKWIIMQYDVNFHDVHGKPIDAKLVAEALDMAIEALTHEIHPETHECVKEDK